MWIITRKFTYLLLMAAIAGLSAPSLNASPQHLCDHVLSSTEKPENLNYSQAVATDNNDACGDCCSAYTGDQTSSTATTADSHIFFICNTQAEADILYTLCFNNLLLRPPII